MVVPSAKRDSSRKYDQRGNGGQNTPKNSFHSVLATKSEQVRDVVITTSGYSRDARAFQNIYQTHEYV